MTHDSLPQAILMTDSVKPAKRTDLRLTISMDRKNHTLLNEVQEMLGVISASEAIRYAVRVAHRQLTRQQAAEVAEMPAPARKAKTRRK